LEYDGNLLRRELFGCNNTKTTLKEKELSEVCVQKNLNKPITLSMVKVGVAYWTTILALKYSSIIS
jgi:hypothetical protein